MSILESKSIFCFDCDGVLWREHEAIPEARNTLITLKQQNKTLKFVTNSSVRTRIEQALRIETILKLPFKIDPEDIITSAFVTANHLKTILPESSAVLLVGSEGIHSELQRVGLQVIKQMEKAEFCDISIAAVVVGFDPNFNYQSISDAVSVFNSNPHALLVACNLDATFMGSEGKVRPGTGSLVSSIVCATGRQPIVMGKPNRFCFDALKDSCMDFDCEKAVFIGDRLDSDIAFGNACGMFSILVETGVHKRSDICDKFIPKLIISNLSELHETNNNEL